MKLGNYAKHVVFFYFVIYTMDLTLTVTKIAEVWFPDSLRNLHTHIKNKQKNIHAIQYSTGMLGLHE